MIPRTGFPVTRLLAAVWMLSFIRFAGRLCRHGMFFDGLIYASISRNLAVGRGDWWHAHFSRTLYPLFYEHPPLLFWVQSWWFRLSESVFVEKLFSALVFALTVALVFRLIDLLIPERGASAWVKAFTFVPWLCYSETGFVVANNLLEGPMGLMALAASIAFLEQARAQGRLQQTVWLTLGAILVAAAVLTKGLPGLFPIVAPVAYQWMVVGGGRGRGLLMSGAAGLAAGALLLCLFALQSDARDFLEHYWQQQVLASVSGQRGSSVPGLSFLTVLKFTLETVAPSLVLIGIAAGMRWKERSRTVRSSYLRAALFLGAIGCAASFPLAVSQRLSAYYLAPSMVFYASGFGFLAAALWPWDPSRLALGDKAWLWTRNVLAAGVVIKVAWLAATWDRPGRDPTYLDLVRVAQQEGVWDEVVGGDPSLRQDWALYAYLMRYLRVSFECRVQPNLSYYIMGADPMQARPPGLVAVEGQCGSATYRLLRRIEPPAADSLSPDGSRQYSKKRDPRD